MLASYSDVKTQISDLSSKSGTSSTNPSNFILSLNDSSSSISFFDIIQDDQNDLSSLEKLIDDDNIFSILSKLKLIQQNNENKNFSYSNELYKELLALSNLDDLYKSAIAANASYTMINASYEENTNNYLNDISIYINNINDELDSYFSIKKERILTNNSLENLKIFSYHLAIKRKNQNL